MAPDPPSNTRTCRPSGSPGEALSTVQQAPDARRLPRRSASVAILTRRRYPPYDSRRRGVARIDRAERVGHVARAALRPGRAPRLLRMAGAEGDISDAVSHRGQGHLAGASANRHGPGDPPLNALQGEVVFDLPHVVDGRRKRFSARPRPGDLLLGDIESQQGGQIDGLRRFLLAPAAGRARDDLGRTAAERLFALVGCRDRWL